MPPTTALRNNVGSSGCASTSRTHSRRNSLQHPSSFEDLAFRTLQALNPNRQLQRSEIRIGKVRKLIGRLLNGQLPAKARRNSTKSQKSEIKSLKNKLINRKISTSSHSSSNSSSNIPSTSQKRVNNRRISTGMPKINEEKVLSVGRKSPKLANALKRRLSLGESTSSQEEELAVEKEPPSQLEEIVERALVEKTASNSLVLIIRELNQLFVNAKSSAILNKKIFQFLDSQLLRSEIDSRRSPQKNIQCIEVHILVELYKLQILLHAVDSAKAIDLEERSKVLPKLRFLNIITGGNYLAKFMTETMDPEFALTLPEQLKQLHERMCIEMSDEFKFLAHTVDQTPDIYNLNGTNPKINNNNLTVETPSSSSLDSTPRNRSNSTPQSSLSAISAFHEDEMEVGFPILEKMSSLGSPPSSPLIKNQDLKENTTSLPQQRLRHRKTSSSTNDSNNGSKISTRRTTLNTDDDPPPILSCPEASDLDEKTDEIEFELPSLPKFPSNRRSSRSTLITSRKRKISVKEEVKSIASSSRRTSTASKTTTISRIRVEARGSIASRRQSNKRLCVIRQNTNGLLQPTSRRSSTASLLQKQQSNQQFSPPRRPSYFERLAQEIQKQKLEEPVPAKKAKLLKEEDKEEENDQPTSSGTSKKSKNPQPIITNAVLQRYKNRMNNLYKHSKELDEHEVFYGRCNIRQDLFESEKIVEDEEQKPTTSKASKSKQKGEQIQRKQKNRSGHLIKNANNDCLYIAHTLLNVHNQDPLSSKKPKPGTGRLIWGSDGRKAAFSAPENQPFRIRRLIRHANRAKVLKLRQYMQRSQQQQLLKKIKKERLDEEERNEAIN